HLKGVGQGDLYVRVKVATPQNLSPEQKEFLRQFEKLEKLKNNS
ncbi:MAG TPA: molecular chaperone DnaJ, partial [Dehalococcoidia bacterium]|nr:molecular chaperone DnaJ [Dehalococcoidia bacterium]